jgi:hypothetical protein
MKKQIALLLLSVLLNVIGLFGQYVEPAVVHDVVIDKSYHFNYVQSKNDKFAYSPSKIFDNDPLTCMAINYNEMKTGFYLKLTFDRRSISLFDKNIDRIIIEPGFFNPEYFKKNARIKKLTVSISGYGANYGKYYSDTFTLEDKMEAQVLLLKKRVEKIWSIEFYVEEIYLGERWQDVCMSGIKLFDGNNELKLRIVPKRDVHIQWYYDDNDQLVMAYWYLLYEHASGMMIVDYKDDKINKLKIFLENFGEGGNEIHKPLYWEYFYIYNNNEVSVIDSDNHIRRQYEIKNNKVIGEKRKNYQPETDSWVFNYNQNGMDNIREYIRQEDSILRLSYNYNEGISEMDCYEDNVIIYSYREHDNNIDILPPIEYIFLN